MCTCVNGFSGVDCAHAEHTNYTLLIVLLSILGGALLCLSVWGVVVVTQKLREASRIKRQSLIMEASNKAKSQFLANMSHEVSDL